MIEGNRRIILITAALCAAGAVIAAAVIFTGRMGPKEASGDAFLFDTAVSIKVVSDNADELLGECFNLAKDLEKVFSPTDPESELYKINDRDSDTVTVSDDMRDCIEKALMYSDLTGGRFDLTIRPVTELWDFHSDEPKVPDKEDIAKALEDVDYRSVSLDGNVLSFSKSGTKIDLGAIAKGYISGKISDLLIRKGCKSALINLGGNVHALGARPDGTPWKIGIQKPFADRGETIAVFPVADRCVISSGTYERYFEDGGELCHHIIDPATGYPADAFYTQVTVTGTSDADCDALATVALLMGSEAALEIADEIHADVEIMTVDSEGNISGSEPEI